MPYETADHYTAPEDYQAQIAALTAERDELLTRAMSDDFFRSIRDLRLDGRELPSGLSAADAAIIEAKTLSSRFLYVGSYRWDLSNPLPDFMMNRRFTYHLQPDATGVAALPDVPAGASDVDYLYFYQRINSASSIGASVISDVPTTWRNATGVFRIVMERTELTSAQQTSIVQGIEREILAGMSSAYTSTSTTARYIDFASGSTGANASLDTTDLVADGWTVVNATQLEKFISAGGGTARRWRVLHQV